MKQLLVSEIILMKTIMLVIYVIYFVVVRIKRARSNMQLNYISLPR